MLKITTPYGSIKYGKDIEIPLTITNPMFNDKGSHSLPFTIPLKPNRALLGFPDSLNNKSAVGEYVDCTIEHTDFFEKGTLKITDISDTEIELSLTTREGAFWELAKEKKLTELNFPESDPYTGDFVAKGNAWKQRIIDCHDKVWPQEVFNAFPVVVNIEKDSSNEWMWGSGISRLVLLNKIDTTTGNIDFHHAGFMNYVSPFLYLNAVIKFIADTYGYKILNELEEYPELNRACIINNATNPIPDGIIRWQQLLPQITVMEFVEALESKFGCAFFLDTNNRTIHLKLAKKIISKTNMVNINGKLNTIKSEPLQIKLKPKQPSGDYSKIVEYEDEYLENHPNGYDFEETHPIYDGYIIAETNIPPVITNRISISKGMESYFFRYVDYVEDETDPFRYKVRYKFLGTRNRTYEPNSQTKDKTFESEILVFSMIPAYIDRLYGKDFYLLPYISSSLKDFIVNEFELTTYDSSVDFPLNICIYRGKYKYNNESYYYPWGSSFTYTRDNHPLNNLPEAQDKLYNDTLTLLHRGKSPDNIGIYDLFWKEIEQYFLKSAKKVAITNVKATDLIKHKLWNVFNIEKNNIIVDEVNITLKANTIEFDSATGYTLKPYS